MTAILTILIIMTITNALTANSYPLPEEVPVVHGPWIQVADENFDAQKYSNKPGKDEKVKIDHQQVSDFTIYQSANGKWQLISAIRETRFPGAKHLLFRWEGDSLEDGSWEEKGILWTTDTKPEAPYKPGVIYAPHCVRDDDGTYYLFVNSSDALALTSEDGIHFKQAKNAAGDYVFFDIGEAGRDLMLMDNRERDGLWYCYYTSMDRARKDLDYRVYHDVYARTANTLNGDWNKPVLVGMGTPDRPPENPHRGATFVNTESPFVIYRNGFYYKFEQSHIVASTDPLDFQDRPIVSTLHPEHNYPEEWWPALAPEIIVDGDRYYVAVFKNHNEEPLSKGGVFVAELKWIKYKAE